MERRTVLIAGSGPAGAATALYLHRRDPVLAGEALLLDKAIHPREKICAGGLIPHVLDCLRELDVPLRVPNARVDAAAVRTPYRRVDYRGSDLCRVVRRSEFDAELARSCVERGIEVRGGEHIRHVARDNDGIRVETDRETYLTRALIGADGSGSRVRRSLVATRERSIGRALMCDVPVAATHWDGFEEHRYDFSFAAVAKQLRGYAWAFPCLVGGAPHVNVGVYSVQPEGSRLRELVERDVAAIGAEATHIKAFPIHGYHRGSRIAGPGFVLAGDAAGVDPLLGEGISYAFEYGRRAADAVVDAVRRRCFDFEEYGRTVHGSWMGRKLGRLELLARVLYGPTSPLWFRLLARSRRAQAAGIRWYNGIDGWDRLGGWELVGAAWRGLGPARAAGAG